MGYVNYPDCSYRLVHTNSQRIQTEFGQNQIESTTTMNTIRGHVEELFQMVDNFQQKLAEDGDAKTAFELVKFVEDYGIPVDDFGHYMSEALSDNEDYTYETVNFLNDQILSTSGNITDPSLDVLENILRRFKDRTSGGESNMSKTKQQTRAILGEIVKYSGQGCFDPTRRLHDVYGKPN